MTRTRLLSIATAALVVLCGAWGCRSGSQPAAPSTSPQSLSMAALKTHANYVKAVKAGAVKPNSDVPPACWTPGIKALEPVRVYSHRANIVVVQHVGHGTETGKYIYTPISSYIPQSGDDGFTFTRTRLDGVYDFTRKPGHGAVPSPRGRGGRPRETSARGPLMGDGKTT